MNILESVQKCDLKIKTRIAIIILRFVQTESDIENELTKEK
jgi:hypothetical protein